MAKKEVLDLKPAPRPEEAGDKRPKQLKECNIAQDDALILPHRANPAGLNFRERQVGIAQNWQSNWNARKPCGRSATRKHRNGKFKLGAKRL
jgi:hypothetical protein